ncbi:DNA recombination/repair protein RecA, partial [bacterium]|nr:DNA recombination/repair protein RecA [bacterium]
RIDLRRIAQIKKGEEVIGSRIKAKVVKNKVAPPFKKVELDLLFNEGISKGLDLLDAALHYGVIKQSGSWFAFDDKKIAQGRDQALKFLNSNKEIADAIFTKVYEVISLNESDAKVAL